MGKTTLRGLSRTRSIPLGVESEKMNRTRIGTDIDDELHNFFCELDEKKDLVASGGWFEATVEGTQNLQNEFVAPEIRRFQMGVGIVLAVLRVNNWI